MGEGRRGEGGGSRVAQYPRRSVPGAGRGEPRTGVLWGEGRPESHPSACGTGCTRGDHGAPLPFTTLSVVDNLGSIALGSDISSRRGTATRCSSVRPIAHPDRTGGPDTQRGRRAEPLGWSLGSELALKLLPAPRVPPPPPPSLLLLRCRQPRRLAPGCACVGLFIYFSEHASRFFFYSWGKGGWGGEAAHTSQSTHPGTETGHRAMEPHARTRPGLRRITWGGPGAREERQGRGCQCHQPRLSVPGGREAVAAAAAASPHRAPPMQPPVPRPP